LKWTERDKKEHTGVPVTFYSIGGERRQIVSVKKELKAGTAFEKKKREGEGPAVRRGATMGLITGMRRTEGSLA